jgi:anti-sigma regulatory factor (Ser/Thr protein kinase)
MDTTSASYAPDNGAPHESRRLVRDFLVRQGAEDLVFVGEVLISELVSNVVRHAHSPIDVDLNWNDGTLRAEVRDGSSIIPAVAELADADGGYGLRIVEAFAQDWGIKQLEHGKAVWFTIRRDKPGADQR